MRSPRLLRNNLVPPGNKPLYVPMLTHVYRPDVLRQFLVTSSAGYDNSNVAGVSLDAGMY